MAQAFSTRVAGLKRNAGSAWKTSEAGNSCFTKPPFIVPRKTCVDIGGATTPASASAPRATSTISDSTSGPRACRTCVCAQPTMQPVMLSLPSRLDAARASDSKRRRSPRVYHCMTRRPIRARAPRMSRRRSTLRRPDDWHVHLRDGAMMAAVLPCTARQFARAIVMPNLVPPVTDSRERAGLSRAHPGGAAAGRRFHAADDLLSDRRRRPGRDRARLSRGRVRRGQALPGACDDHSAHGVTDIDRVMPVLERMAAIGMPLLIHGEVTDPEVDIFDREAVFIERVLDPLRRRLPELRDRARAHHDRGGGRLCRRRRRRTSPRRSPRIIS